MLIPQPPIEMMVDKTAEFWITATLGGIAVCGVLFALAHWARTKRPMVLLLMAAGSAMMIFEPLVDTVGGCWFPKNSIVAFEAWGRPMPLWLCLGYFFYFGIASSTVWMALRRGMTRAQIHIAFVLAMLGDLAFESVLLIWDPYTYYGWQPLWLPNGFPLWWMPVNALVPMVLGAIVYQADDWFRGLRALAVIPVGLMTSAAVNAAVGWPSWTVINTDLGPVLTQAGGVLTFVLAFSMIRVLCHFVATDTRAPLRVGGALTT